MNLFLIFLSLSMIAWLVILLLPWQPWRNTEILAVDHDRIYPDLSEVTAVIPARDESQVIRSTLEGLNSQGENLKVIIVDDGSTDGTAEIAASREIPNLQIIPGSRLPEGWNGKIWALEQGVRLVTTGLTLLLDADIELGPGVLAALMDRMKSDNRQLVSIMASLKMKNGWEKLLMPAFIYFFKMLYPFKLAKSSNRRFFSAAGGCILLDTEIFNQIGGLSVIRGAVIDDCALAKVVKQSGKRIWIGQSLLVKSTRDYRSMREIVNMVARTAYSQLMYSPLILLGVSIMLILLFLVPVSGLFLASNLSRFFSILILLLLSISYFPTIAFYNLSLLWSFSLPLSGSLYLLMTWISAWRFYRGERTRWKGRSYQ